MNSKINCILLVDDNVDDNFFHERVIRKNDLAQKVVAKQSGIEALNYLKEHSDNLLNHPDLIFLDINMPGMNGWEFLNEYKKFDKAHQNKAVVIMLTTSENPDDRAKADKFDVIREFKIKPLTREIITEIREKYFL
jgi:CheY-like chemotaxis protein